MKTILQKLSLILIIGLIFNINIFAKNYFGSGTQEDPYQITSEQDLYDITYTTEDWGAYFIQTADINVTNTGSFGIIGNSTTKFTGTYDGQGYTISNLIISESGADYVGLFGYINRATIKNLHLASVTVSGGSYVGGLIGYSYNSTVVDCSTTGSVAGASNYTGGLVGYVNSYTTISKSYSECTVTGGGQYIGGFVGENISYSVIEECYAAGDVSVTQTDANVYVGGFVGENSASISKCFSTGAVDGNSSSYVGGFVGQNRNRTIELSYSTGNVTNGDLYVGGFAGANFYFTNTPQILRCYSSGDVSGNGYIGGFVGYIYKGDVKNSYSTGSVTRIDIRSTNVGGFCGSIQDEGNIKHSYSTGSVIYTNTTDKGFVGNENSFTGSYNANFFGRNVSNQATGAGATATNYLDDPQTFTNVSSPDTPWDIIGVQGAGPNNYWEMVTGINNGYPFLRLQYSSPTNGVRAITANSATCGGNVFDNGSNDVTECGICWGTSSSPTTADSKTSDGTGTGTFTSSITGLSASTTYYVRAYVTNNVGTSYGDEETFTTDSATPVELTTFTGIADKAGVILSWNTATEVNNYGFQVEKKKENGKSNWDAISFV